uniref:Uncharacterized protein n=1 Tax=Anguilla anguilla TaxID=7936 RepID=A0A0E9V4U6_ANGAN
MGDSMQCFDLLHHYGMCAYSASAEGLVSVHFHIYSVSSIEVNRLH